MNATTPATQKSAEVKLVKLEVKKFNGTLHKWQEFWVLFKSAIHTNKALSNIDKFSFLRGLLLEHARLTIAGFALTSANYESAVDLLKRRYAKMTVTQQTLRDQSTGIKTPQGFAVSTTISRQSNERCRP